MYEFVKFRQQSIHYCELQNSTSSTSTKQRHLLRCMAMLAPHFHLCSFQWITQSFSCVRRRTSVVLKSEIMYSYVYLLSCVYYVQYVCWSTQTHMCFESVLNPCYCSIDCCASFIHKLFCIIFTKVLLPVLNIDWDKKVQVMFDSRLKWK